MTVATRIIRAPADALIGTGFGTVSGRTVGIAIASIIPAMFWTAIIWSFCSVIGSSVSAGMLASVGLSILAFVASVCDAIFPRA